MVVNVYGKLGSIARDLTAMNSRMDHINAMGLTPPDDNVPVLAALAQITSQANLIITSADELERQFGIAPARRHHARHPSGHHLPG